MEIRRLKSEDWADVDRGMAGLHALHVRNRPDVYLPREHVLPEKVALSPPWDITDVSDSTVNISEKSFFLKIHKTEGIADIIAAVIDDLRISAHFFKLPLEGITLENRPVIVIIVECDHAYTLFFHFFPP